MRIGRRALQLGHRIHRHEAVRVLSIVRIIAPQRRLGFAGDLASGFDADILHQRLGVFLQIRPDFSHIHPTWLDRRPPWGNEQVNFPFLSCRGIAIPYPSLRFSGI